MRIPEQRSPETRAAALALREIAAAIEGTEMQGDYIGSEERWEPDVARTLELLAHRLKQRAERLDPPGGPV